ncbi:hypothetical protein ILUMI_19019 [Ignelater luminosus]|uniref:PiggyBac transposable element-derived protein domain-containing protein n=1 Tax=Ignelater luminosus TaxID=2038154 RepID=A0A8K0CGX7_IGNLU|nr:hypothetical protein ILUMI_19019 [Ignelater luminosus]
MAEELIHFERSFTLENALYMLEDDNNYAERVENITIFPPVNATSELTDEDSADGDFSFEDDVPLSELRKSLPSKPCKENTRKLSLGKQRFVNYTTSKFDDTYSPENLDGPLQVSSKFFDDHLIELIVRESNRYAQQRNRKGNIESHEIKGFIGIFILSGYIQVKKRRIFWQRERMGIMN